MVILDGARRQLRRWRDRLFGPSVESQLAPQGIQGVELLGHRTYVGGLWEQIGQLQFAFLCSRGLRPDQVLLDIACGSLRLGVHAIPYLHPGHYLGIEKEAELLRRGVDLELGHAQFERFRPQLIANATFEFHRFDRLPDVAIAQSLFTHLPAELIGLCLQRLLPCLKPSSVLYATFFQSRVRQRLRPKTPHDHASFHYTHREIVGFGECHGYTVEYIGAWNHPRDQVIVAYRPKPTLSAHALHP